MPCRCKPCAWCSPLLMQNKTMKKQLLTLALLAVAGTAGAQTSTPASQVPNGNFEGSWVACKPWTGCGDTKEMNKQPEKWTVSNVVGYVRPLVSFLKFKVLQMLGSSRHLDVVGKVTQSRYIMQPIVPWRARRCQVI